MSSSCGHSARGLGAQQLLAPGIRPGPWPLEGRRPIAQLCVPRLPLRAFCH